MMWRLAELDAKDFFPYFLLPRLPKENNTDTRKHTTSFRNNVFHHIFGSAGREAIKEYNVHTTGNQFVAPIHFKPGIRRYIFSEQESKKGKLHKWRVPHEIGIECGLTELDKCKGKNTDNSFFPSPNNADWNDIEKEVADLEAEARLRTSASGATESIASRPSGARASEFERELKKVTNKITHQSVEQTAIEIMDNRERIEELEGKVEALSAEMTKQKEEHEKEMQELHDKMMKQMMRLGMNRYSLLNDDYYKENPWLSVHLYGKTWGEHIAIGRALFHVKPVMIVSFKDRITEFEKYSIATMVARRGYAQETIAAMYNKDRSRISRYLKKWSPMLGRAGQNMSELDMEMNLNHMSIEDCIAANLPYMENGVAKNLDPSAVLALFGIEEREEGEFQH